MLKNCLWVLLLIVGGGQICSAQTVVHLDQIQPEGKIQHLQDKLLHSDQATEVIMVWAEAGFQKKRTAGIRENIMVLEGKVNFIFDGKVKFLKPGDWLLIPEDTPHLVEVVGEETLKLFVIQQKPG